MAAGADRTGSRLPAIPVTYFGAVLGFGGLGSAWRAAHRVWNLPAFVGETLSLIAAGTWLLCALAFAVGWWRGADAVRGDFRDPTRAAFAALLPMSTMIAGFALRPYAAAASLAMIAAALAAQILLGAWATGTVWRGDRAALRR